MSENIFVSNATNVLKEVVVCSPKFYVFNAINEITKSWMEKGEAEQNERMVAEWQTLVDAYKANEVIVHEVDAYKELEVQTFARDFGAMVKEGAIIGQFRHPARQKETEVYEEKLKELGVPIIARVNAGCFEGGDFWMIDEHTLAFGLVDRTDQAGVDNLREQLAKYGYTVVGVPVPPANLHLDMVFNIVAEKVCIAATEQLPYNFIQMLKRRNFKIIDVPSELVFKHGCNVQALGNGKVLGIENNKSVNEAMEAEGIKVIKLPLEQILKAGGGPHCMTYPVRRA
ncbi:MULTISPECIES: dimethylarginine dimethylaminohydrolase family protein [Enterococcus]|uniref:dimethylarginine dimethylaminohydrolase family protein n=1 Tax=Enterococcus TaxID=1350 RepID=UPI0011645C39|nr:arginine deiminase family protein [Enterococcus avium]HAP3020766.1 nitrate reductase [Enterococcus faecalis]AYQ24013.1 nitrate reductase [Enterococcus avium]HBI1561102.1 nitrate reductase [Enterococcus faecalis]HBI1564375.1 nitrate reductase [Enterococcus faecalis]HBI1716941.1 nitrate reductase [Enterococcus faecalis]